VAGTVLLALPLGAIASCTRVADRERFEPNPQALEIVRTAPPAGARDVDPQARIDLCLSGLVDPRSLFDPDASLASGRLIFDVGVDVELVPWTGPGGARAEGLSEPWCGGSVIALTPKADLAAGVRYRILLEPTAVDWDGELLDTEAPGWLVDHADGVSRFVLEFTVSAAEEDEPAVDPPVEPAVTLGDLFAPEGPFDPDRKLCNCHAGDDDLAMARLDLSDADRAYAGLVGSAEARDTGFPMVAPFDPSGSFLVHKLLRDEDGEPLRGVLGASMPRDRPQLDYEDLRRIMQWVADGAVR